jgi:glycosyltransferase involved in cell wall biosynthesis
MGRDVFRRDRLLVTANGRAVSAAVTVVITAKDEELHVGRCLDSALPLGRAIGLERGSENPTLHIARAHGAEVVEHLWGSYSAQRNWALENLRIETELVLFLDADEYLTEDLRTEITAAIKADSIDGFCIAQENIVLGRRLRHGCWYPDYQMRLFHRRRDHHEKRLVREHAVIDGKTDFLRPPLQSVVPC